MFPDPQWKPFFWQSKQKVGGDQLKGKKTIFKRFVGIRKMVKPPLARPFLHRHLHQSRPDQTRIVVPAIRLLQWLTTSYRGQQKMKKTSKREGSGLAGTAKKWVEKCTAKWKIAQSEWKCWPGIEQRNRSYPVRVVSVERGVWAMEIESESE